MAHLAQCDACGGLARARGLPSMRSSRPHSPALLAASSKQEHVSARARTMMACTCGRTDGQTHACSHARTDAR
eukprot:1521697-Alexandrium_andersonii.AAC.1